MRKFSVACAAAALALAALAGAPAQAALYNITYTGHVGFSVKLTDMFGAADYNGLAYALVYTVDDAALNALFTTSPEYTDVHGPGVVTAALTVNGVTKTINGSNSSIAEATDGIHLSGQPYSGKVDKVREMSTEYSEVAGGLYHNYTAETYISSYLQDFVANRDFRTPFIFTPGGTDSIYSLVQFNDYDFGTKTQINYAYFNLGIDYASFSRVGASSDSAAPEPQAWALMLLGFGGAGALMRRRRAALAG